MSSNRTTSSESLSLVTGIDRQPLTQREVNALSIIIRTTAPARPH